MSLSLAFIDSPEQLLLVLAIALLFFGPAKLPQLGSSLGKAIKAYRDGIHEEPGQPEHPAALNAPASACSKCGAELSGSAAFCPRCGIAIS